MTRKLLLFSSFIRKCSVSHLLSTSTNPPILSAYRDSPFWIEESLDMSVPVIHLWKTSPCTVWSIYPIKKCVYENWLFHKIIKKRKKIRGMSLKKCVENHFIFYMVNSMKRICRLYDIVSFMVHTYFDMATHAAR